jgi:cell wall-associated NlpC family hydrolase
LGGGYDRTKGLVTAAEVSAALVRALGKSTVAQTLEHVSSPDGWQPVLGRRFGTEIVAREMGLRYNRLEPEDAFETSAEEHMPQADAVYAVWKAKTSPSTWNADALTSFSLSNYSETRRQVVQFALSLVGTPYVWGGEWKTSTPTSYPYGAQSHGGFDCSGFAWYVLKEKSTSWDPAGRDYTGWSFPERSSAEMAKAAETRLGFGKLLPGDVVFFAPGGRDAKAGDVYHAGIYLGNGWMVHSSGSRAGISLASIGPGSWWNDQLAWGRRIITK